MGRKASIIGSVVLVVIAGVNIYLNYLNWSLSRPGRSEVGQLSIFNMVMMTMLGLIALGRIWKLLTAPGAERILDPHRTLAVEESLVVRSCRAVAFSLIIVAGVWAFSIDGAPLAAIAIRPLAGVLFIAVGVFGMARLVFNPRQRLVLTPQSLTYSQLRPAVIGWEDVTDVQLKSYFTTKVISLRLRGSHEFRPASLLARWRRVEKIVFFPITFGVEPDVLKRGIELRREVFTF